MATKRFYTGAAPKTTLSASITSGATTLIVTSAQGYPAQTPFFIAVDSEKCLVTAASGASWTVTRAQDNTTAVAHNAGAPIVHVFTAVDATDANSHITVVSQDDHTQYIKTAGDRAFTGQSQISAVPGASAIGDTAATGSSLQLANALHVHARETAVGGTQPSAWPTGAMNYFVGSVAPNADWLLCDGSAVSRTTYAALFAVIASTYGGGDGSTTFNVPDMRGRAPVGVGTGTGGGASGTGLPAGGSALTARSLGAWAGAETNVLATANLAAHSHTTAGDSHSHGMNQHAHGTANDSHAHNGGGTNNFAMKVAGQPLGLNGAGDGRATYAAGNTAAAAAGLTINNTTETINGTAATGISTQNNGSGTAHNNMQPSMCLNMLIKT